MVSRYLRLVVGACLLITESLRGAGSGDSGAVCAQAGSVRACWLLGAIDIAAGVFPSCSRRPRPLNHLLPCQADLLPTLPHLHVSTFPLPALHLLIVSPSSLSPFVHASSPLPLRPLCTHLPPPSLPLVHASSPLPLRPLCTHLPPSLSPATMGSSQQLTRSSVQSHSATSLSLPLRPFCSRFPSSQQSPSVSPIAPIPTSYSTATTIFPPCSRRPRPLNHLLPCQTDLLPLSHLSTSLPSPLPAPPNGLLPSLSAPSALISPHPLSTVMTGSSLQSTPRPRNHLLPCQTAPLPSAPLIICSRPYIVPTPPLTSHDGFFPAVDALIRSITFCPVKQIYFPLSLHLQNGSFPNRSP
ncbi:unnamed protein product [Closterium sp. NIES-65]|nr:unnamed protein product [Closterium sp. NIES-65]